MRKVFTGQLNTDSHPKFLPEGDYTGAKNIFIHTSKGGDSGLVRRYPGFDIIGDLQDQTTVGTVVDKANNKVYYFNKSDTDQIWCYNLISNTKELVMEYDFRFGNWVNGGVIANLLYFTDNVNEIRAIDTSREYSSITEQDITLIKPAPLYSLYTAKIKETINYSALSGKGYYFSYRYIYENNQTSVIAPYTNAVYCPDQAPYVTGVNLEKNIKETVPTYVEKVDILARSNEELSWRIVQSLSREDFLTETFLFKGLKGRAISDRESGKPFENIPLRSKTLTVAKDRVFVANNTEGYSEYETPGLKLVSSTEDVTPDPEYVQVWKSTKTQSDNIGTPENPIIEIQVTRNYWARLGNHFYFLATGNYNRSVDGFPDPVVPGDYTGNEDVLSKNQSDFSPIDDVVYGSFIDENNYVESSVTKAVPDHFLFLTLSYNFAVGQQKFKNRSQYQIGIVFYDKYLRNQGVYTNENCIKTVDDDFRDADIQYLRWELSVDDPIPDWAETYQIVRTDNLSKVTFLQGQTSDIYWVYQESSVDKYSREYRTDAEFIEIDISGGIKAGVRYNFTEGDLIDIEVGSRLLTFQLESAVGSKLRVLAINDIAFTANTEPFPRRYYYEIYRPRTEQPSAVVNGEEVSGNIFYEVSESFKILSPFTENRSFEVMSGFLKGDVTVINTETYNYPDNRSITTGEFSTNELEETPVTIAIEATNLDNGEWIKDLGRPNAVLGIGQVQKKNFIRYSNRFIQGTNVNGTSNFDFGDEDQIPIENGEINVLSQVSKANNEGSILLAVCAQEVLSIYVNERIITDNVGTEVLAQSAEVIGTINPLRGGYGTIHPKTFQTYKGRAWWWDENSKKIVRYDSNGVRSISDLGNKSFFFPKTDPVTCYDPWHDVLFVGFGENCIGFHEETNQWRSTYDFIPEFSAIVDEYMITFKQGTPFKSNGTGFSFYGTEYSAEIEFPVTFPVPTIMDNVSLYMTQDTFEWLATIQKIKGDVTITISNLEGQITSLISDDFDVYESVAYAHVLGDENSDGGLINGYEMRSDIHTFKVVFDTGIEYINVNETISLGQR